MNIGKGRWNPKYICDKCGEEIQYIAQKGFVGINHYLKSTHRANDFLKEITELANKYKIRVHCEDSKISFDLAKIIKINEIMRLKEGQDV